MSKLPCALLSCIHIHIPCIGVLCAYVLFQVCESRYVSVWVCACALKNIFGSLWPS